MFVVETYRGCESGWHQTGRARAYREASSLLVTVRKIRPDFMVRLRCLSPELPTFTH